MKIEMHGRAPDELSRLFENFVKLCIFQVTRLCRNSLEEAIGLYIAGHRRA